MTQATDNLEFDHVRLLPVFVLALLLLLPIVDFVFPKLGFEPVGRRYAPTTLVAGWQDVLQGRIGGKVEEFFENRSFLFHGTGAIYNEAIFRITGRIPGLRASDDDWLFLRSNLDELEAGTVDELVAENVEFIREAQFQLKQRNQKLFVVLIPDRGRLYPGKGYSRGEEPPNRARFLPDLADALGRAGIANLDLTEAFEQEVEAGRDPFFEVDHHWSFDGSKAAAKSVADWLGGAIQIPTQPPARELEITRSFESETPHRSLVTLLKFAKESRSERVFLRGQATESILPSYPELIPNDESPRGAGITLESSFGMFGFPQYLGEALGTSIDAIVEPGNGSVYSMARYLTEPGVDDLHPFVVWVIPEYHLVEGLRNQGAGRSVRLPSPFSQRQLEDSVKPREVSADGAREEGKVWKMQRNFARFVFEFQRPVEGVRLNFSCEGGRKRGQIFCPPSTDEGLLVFAGTPGRKDYDFRLTEPSRRVEVGLLINESGVEIRRLRAAGIPARGD